MPKLGILKPLRTLLSRPLGLRQKNATSEMKRYMKRKSKKCKVCGSPATTGISTNPLQCTEWYCDKHEPKIHADKS